MGSAVWDDGAAEALEGGLACGVQDVSDLLTGVASAARLVHRGPQSILGDPAHLTCGDHGVEWRPGAMAFVLGAVLASTDPVAVTALARQRSLDLEHTGLGEAPEAR